MAVESTMPIAPPWELRTMGTLLEVLESIKDGILLAIECLVKEGKEIPEDKIEEQIVTSAQVKVPANLKTSYV